MLHSLVSNGRPKGDNWIARLRKEDEHFDWERLFVQANKQTQESVKRAAAHHAPKSDPSKRMPGTFATLWFALCIFQIALLGILKVIGVFDMATMTNLGAILAGGLPIGAAVAFGAAFKRSIEWTERRQQHADETKGEVQMYSPEEIRYRVRSQSSDTPGVVQAIITREVPCVDTQKGQLSVVSYEVARVDINAGTATAAINQLETVLTQVKTLEELANRRRDQYMAEHGMKTQAQRIETLASLQHLAQNMRDQKGIDDGIAQVMNQFAGQWQREQEIDKFLDTDFAKEMSAQEGKQATL